MSKGHKDLPAGSQQWASDVDRLMDEVKQLKAVVRRLTENAGIDMSNPSRGINTGATPNAKNPVGQKLSSLADVDTYNVLDGQSLTWSGQGQKWLPATPKSGGGSGAQWRKATDDELLQWDLVNDSGETETTPQVMGVVDTTGTTGTMDSYGLIGTADAAAFLHAAGRYWGGPTRAHGYVSAEPYYTKMGVTWIDDAGGSWDSWGEVNIERGSIYISTPRGEPSLMPSEEGRLQRDGIILLRTNWFYPPLVNDPTGYRPVSPPRPVPLEGVEPSAGAMCYDVYEKKPIFWEGSKWVDAMGNDIPPAQF